MTIEQRLAALEYLSTRLASEAISDDDLRFVVHYCKCVSEWERLGVLAGEITRLHAHDLCEVDNNLSWFDGGDIE